MNKNTIIDFRTGNNGKGIRLNRADIETLLFLFEHKLISQTQLYEFYILFKGMHYDSFRKRMSKFAKNKIIQFKRYEFTKKKNGIAKDLILLDVEGYEILYAAGFLKEEREEYQNWTNWDRTLATKEVVLQAFKFEMLRTGVLFGVENRHLYVSPKAPQRQDTFSGKLALYKNQPPLYFSWNPAVFNKAPHNIFYSSPSYRGILPVDVEPDWILGLDRRFINIEIDMGYRTLIGEEGSNTKSVDELIREYVELSHKFPIELSILYIYLDDSIPFRKNYGRKIQRIKNFKQKIMDDKDIRDSSLNIYVVSLERSENVLKNLLSIFHGEQSKLSILQQTLAGISNSLNEDADYSISRLAGEHIHRLYPLTKDLIDEALLVTRKEGNQKSERILIPAVILEGDIRSHNDIQKLSHELKVNKMMWGLPYDTKVLMIYPDKESMMNDILRDDLEQNSICLTNMEDIKKYSETNQPIKLYDITRRGEISFEHATRCD